MGAKTTEVGGGPTVGLAENYVNFLQSIMNTGGMGTAGSPDAFGTTGGVFGILSELLSPGAGRPGASMSAMLSKQHERDVAGLRARYGAGGGVAFGTPAAHAESLYRAEAAPRETQAITGLQLQALMPLLGQIGQFSQMGIAPRQIVQEKGFLGEALGTIAPIAEAALPFLVPGFGAAAAGSGAFAGLTQLGIPSNIASGAWML